MPGSRSHAGAAALPVVVLLLLAGCVPAPPQPSPTASPAAMPDVPLIDGRVVGRSGGDGDWRVWVRSADPQQGYREARRLIRNAGYTLTKDREAPGGGDGQACTAAACVQFTGHDDMTYGPTVEYEIFLPATSGAP